MMTVHEVSALTGVTVRALQYYDRIGLLPPAQYTGAGYRLYDEVSLERLQQILLFRELDFSLSDIQIILGSPEFDRTLALEQQIAMLKLKKQRLEKLISLAENLRQEGADHMDFKAFDSSKLEEYASQAKAAWGETEAWREYEEKSKNRSKKDSQDIGEGLMELFKQFGQMKSLDPSDSAVQAQVGRLQSYITEHYYHCTTQILSGLGRMYSAGGEFTANIDSAGGEGTAQFVNQAIEIYCANRQG